MKKFLALGAVATTLLLAGCNGTASVTTDDASSASSTPTIDFDSGSTLSSLAASGSMMSADASSVMGMEASSAN